MDHSKHRNSELSNSELCRLLDCKEDEFDQFEEVDLSYLSSDSLTVRYETIPALDGLMNLERLTICNHNISDLTPVISLKKLVYLDLSHNAISNIRPITSLCLLEELHLSYNSIYKFPRDLYKLRNLRILSLSHNKITYDAFQDILALSRLESLDLAYNPVTMRDKENRRDIVFFLHNRLHHFELFNGIHIATLYARVSCGKDYLEDIIDSELASPPFVIPSRHILTIGEQKNLLGRPKQTHSPLNVSSEVPVSPFCLDGEQAVPHTPTYCKRIGEKPQKNDFLLNEVSEDKEARNRSTSMFETLNTQVDFIPSPTEQVEEKPQGRRHRGFSVHDVILKNQSGEESGDGDDRPAISMFNNKDIRVKSSTVDKGIFGNLNTNTIPVKTEGRKPLFSKTEKKMIECSSQNRMIEELRRINDSLVKIMQSQQRMENRLNHLENRINSIASSFKLDEQLY